MKNYPINLTDTQYAAFEVITPLSEKFERMKRYMLTVAMLVD